MEVVIDGGALINWLGSFPDPAVEIPDIPLAIQQLVDGTPTEIARSRAFAANPAGFGAVGYGLMYGVICSEWVPFEPQSQEAPEPATGPIADRLGKPAALA